MSEGARNAVEVCTAVREGEHVLFLMDCDTLEVGEALCDAAEKVSTES